MLDLPLEKKCNKKPVENGEHHCSTSDHLMMMIYMVSEKGFLAPGNGKGNCKSHSRFTGRERELENATGGEGKFEARITGNHGKQG